MKSRRLHWVGPWVVVAAGVWLALGGRRVLVDGIRDDRLDLATPFSLAFDVAAVVLAALGVRALRLGVFQSVVAAVVIVAATLPYDWFAGTRAAFAINVAVACGAAAYVLIGMRARSTRGSNGPH